MLKVDSWDSLGFQMQQVPSLNLLILTEVKHQLQWQPVRLRGWIHSKPNCRQLRPVCHRFHHLHRWRHQQLRLKLPGYHIAAFLALL
ncbi:hypothetical protein ACFX13_013051 [Malus domestica]